MFTRQPKVDLKSNMWNYGRRSHAETCPVCNGKGKILKREEGYTSGRPEKITCHGCFGKGWITVKD